MLKKQRVRTAYIWMLLVFISLILWLLILVIPKDRFAPLILSDWFRFGEINISLRFVLNSQNWILAISLFAFNLAFFLTGIARLDVRTDLQYWIIQLVLTAFSFLAVLSADLWSVVLLWTALDLLDLVYHRTIRKEIGGITYFRKIIFKFLGSMLLIWNIAVLSKSGVNPLLEGLVASTSNTPLFLAALLHSGIFPLNAESESSIEKESGKLLKSAFGVTNFVVSFSLVFSLSAPKTPFLLSFLISLLSYSLIIISMIRWVLEKDLEESLKFLLIGEAGGFVFLYFSGNTQYLSYMLALITLSVLWLALYTHRGKNLVIFPLINIFFASGLPISLIAFGPRGFIGNEFSVGLAVLIVAQVLFLLGYLKYAFEKNEKFNDLEVWYQAAYLAGLFLPLLSVAAVIVNSISSLANEIQYWSVGVIVVTLASIGYFYAGRIKIFNKSSQYLTEARLAWLWQSLTFEWLFKTLSFIENKARNFINGFSGLLEGEGGILWAVVLLLLILTLLR
ncbi:MAG: hypothetical protein Q8N39_05955 [Pelolinea sp.]|nr:hypothetical protein [Pelolinea sp.]